MRITMLALVLAALMAVPALVRAAEDAESAVTNRENALAKACVENDVKVYESALSDRFRGVNADGSVESKKPYIDDLRNGTFKCSEYKLKDVGCQTVGDVVIFHATVSQKATWNGNDCSGNYQLTNVWAKEDGQWRCVHSQWTAVAKP